MKNYVGITSIEWDVFLKTSGLAMASATFPKVQNISELFFFNLSSK